MSTSIHINDYGALSRGIFAQTSDSLPVTNTNVETSIIDGGVGTLTIPANSFKVGDSFVASLGGHISSLNNSDLQIRIKSGSIMLGDTGLFNMPQCSGNHFDLQVRFTIRAIGVAGVASVSSFGQFTYSKDASNAFEGSDFAITNNTTFDTTISNTLNITAQWDAANAANSIYTESFILTKIY